MRNLIICSDWHVLKDSLLQRIAAKSSSYCICVTSYLRKSLIERFTISPKRIFVTPNGIDLSIFDKNISQKEARLKSDLPDQKIILGYFGRFKTMGMEKGISDTLRALVQLDDRFVFFAAGGYEKDVAYYAQLAKELGVESKVIFRGESTQDQLATYQKACDVLLMPFPNMKHYAYDMSPMKMFEYMASERPIITSDLPSVRDVLNEQNAYFIPPDAPAAIAEAVQKLVADPALRERLANKAKQDVAGNTWDQKAKNIIAFLGAAS